jgi:hypothetical protein
MMQTYPECFVCFVQQTVSALKAAGIDETRQFDVIRQVMSFLPEADLSESPSHIVAHTNHILRAACGIDDFYAAYKQASTQQALALYPRLVERVRNSADPLDTAVRLSLAGNIIDVVNPREFDLSEVIERTLAQPYAADGLAPLRAALEDARSLLFLADNAGETVFDRVLVETLAAPVIYAVKGGPILNDATLQEAVAAGLDRTAELVSTGADSPGTILEHCSPEFRRRYESADVIIAKGQANYETLPTDDPRLFFLLQVKCPVIARDSGLPQGGIVIQQGRASGAAKRNGRR